MSDSGNQGFTLPDWCYIHLCWCYCTFPVDTADLCLTPSGPHWIAVRSAALVQMRKQAVTLHISSRFLIALENPCRSVVMWSSASNRWQRGRSLVWSRHTTHCKGCWRVSSSRWIMPALCPMFTLVPSQATIFMLSVFTFCSFKLATNDSVMSLLEPNSRVVWLKYEEPGSAVMLMCSSVTVSLWYLLSMPRTCVKVWSLWPSKNTPSMPVWWNWSSFSWSFLRVLLHSRWTLLWSIT